ncbi:hypothetical protein Tco_1130305 [Tanacetum coccineum]
MKVKESLNVTFDETPTLPNTSPLEDDDLVKEEAIKVNETQLLGNDVKDKSLENNEIINIKESKSHPLENVIALIDYGIRLDDIPITCDNKGAIDLSKNPVQHSRTKHIEIRHHFLRKNVQKGNISIEKVSSEDNIADILTKPLKRELFNYLRLDEVDTPTPMPKPPSPYNKLLKKSSPISPSKQTLPQPHSPLLIDPYVNVVLQANQNRNETQPQLPPSPTRDMLVDEINQLQDLSNLLAMHLSNHTTNPTPSTPNLPHTITFDQVEHHVTIAHVVATTKLNSWL